MNKGDLMRTAAEMRGRLQNGNGLVEREVGGYHLALFKREESLRLFVGLLSRFPTMEECRPVLDAFGAPAETEPLPGVHKQLTQDGKYIRVNALKFPWIEFPTAQQ